MYTIPVTADLLKQTAMPFCLVVSYILIHITNYILGSFKNQLIARAIEVKIKLVISK